jgi:hypothetical protein
VARELQIGVACSVAFTVAASAVELEAVDLDGEAVGWPVCVDLVGCCCSLNYGIEGGGPNVGGGLQERFEPPFELALLGA